MILKAQEINQSTGLKFIIGFVEPTSNGRWSASTRLWNGVTEGKAKDFISFHSTMDEALQEVEKMAVKYPNGEDSPSIIVEDTPREGDYVREEKAVNL